jgi:hypothetical protein
MTSQSSTVLRLERTYDVPAQAEVMRLGRKGLAA